MDLYELVLLGAGLVVLLAAWLPVRLADRPLSLPIVLVAIGAAVFSLPVAVTPRIDAQTEWFERAAELGVLVSLMGAGLKLDRPIGWRSWSTTWRLLGIGMPLTIAMITGLGLVAGLSAGAALLLGAVLSPTDPVLAADVQVGEPTVGDDDDVPATGDEDEVRFSLTSEAGLNDGLAFPFVYAALALEEAGGDITWTGVADWLAIDLVLRLVLGVAGGWLVGKVLSRLMFPTHHRMGLAETATGFVALAATLLAYGAVEAIHGYGFVAVFVAALTIRSAERGNTYHSVLHNFAEEIEQLLVVGLLVLLGGALAGGILTGLGWTGVAVALTCILVARPLACRLALAGSPIPAREQRTISFFGIRGIGSIYYLAYATTSHDIDQPDRVWAMAAFTVLVSIVIHGVAATPAMHRIDRYRDRRATARTGA
ncbi:MAG: cation:proton antiporter [Acidimicrobiales bacterium]